MTYRGKVATNAAGPRPGVAGGPGGAGLTMIGVGNPQMLRKSDADHEVARVGSRSTQRAGRTRDADRAGGHVGGGRHGPGAG